MRQRRTQHLLHSCRERWVQHSWVDGSRAGGTGHRVGWSRQHLLHSCRERWVTAQLEGGTRKLSVEGWDGTGWGDQHAALSRRQSRTQPATQLQKKLGTIAYSWVHVARSRAGGTGHRVGWSPQSHKVVVDKAQGWVIKLQFKIRRKQSRTPHLLHSSRERWVTAQLKGGTRKLSVEGWIIP